MKVVPKKWKSFYLNGHTMRFFPQTQNLEPPRGGSSGVGGAPPPPPPPTTFLRWTAAYCSSAKKKTLLVVYWFWGKTWDEVEEFMLNAVKMVVKMVGLQWCTLPKKNPGSAPATEQEFIVPSGIEQVKPQTLRKQPRDMWLVNEG